MPAQELFTTPLFSDPSLVSYWRAEGNSNDAVGSNNGTDTAITYNSGNGKFGQGAGFNGSTSKIAISGSGSLNLHGNAITINLWVKGNQTTNTIGRLVWKIGSKGYQMSTSGTAYSPNNAWAFSVVGTNAFDLGGGTSGDQNDGNWHMITGTYDGTTMTLYRDGISVATHTISNGLDTSDTGGMTLASNAGTAEFFNGDIDDVSIFSRALTPTEVSNLFNGFPATSIPAVGASVPNTSFKNDPKVIAY